MYKNVLKVFKKCDFLLKNEMDLVVIKESVSRSDVLCSYEPRDINSKLKPLKGKTNFFPPPLSLSLTLLTDEPSNYQLLFCSNKTSVC